MLCAIAIEARCTSTLRSTAAGKDEHDARALTDYGQNHPAGLPVRDFVARVDGLKFQANDEWGKPVPRPEIDLLIGALDGQPFPGDFYHGQWFQNLWT
jgi:hypothetical protein